MGPGPKFLTWAESGQFFVAPVRSAIFHLGLENFPLKIPNFPIFSLRVKKNTGQRWNGFLFTASKKYARVGSSQGPALLTCTWLAKWPALTSVLEKIEQPTLLYYLNSCQGHQEKNIKSHVRYHLELTRRELLQKIWKISTATNVFTLINTSNTRIAYELRSLL